MREILNEELELPDDRRMLTQLHLTSESINPLSLRMPSAPPRRPRR